jgi:glycosyltransferase involved in cell wall biosynthesis
MALVSSGLGFARRGIETWMVDLANHLPPDVPTEVWSGGPLPAAIKREGRRVRALSRDSPWIRHASWHRRYVIEQLSMLPATLLGLRRRKIRMVYLGDPVLAWHLKRFRSWHGARVIFLNGMRLSARWACSFDGVHLLASPYLQHARDELPNADLSNFFVVPHFTSLEFFRPPTLTQRLEARARFSLEEARFAILSIGPIGRVSGKRLEHLAMEISEASDSAMLLHAGADEVGARETRNAVNQALGSRVRWMGPMDRLGIQQLMAAADVYSLGSLHEPFSIAIIEALASGLPVVHHHDEVMHWQIGPGGVPVDMTIPGSAANAFTRLAADPDHRRSHGAAGRQLAETRYGPGAVCAEWIKALATIAARHSPP